MTNFNPSHPSVSDHWFYRWRGLVALSKMHGFEEYHEMYQYAAAIANMGYVINLALELNERGKS